MLTWATLSPALTLHVISRDVDEKGWRMDRIDRWYVEIWEGKFPSSGSWRRIAGRWIFEAAREQARQRAINGGTWTRLVKDTGPRPVNRWEN
jgi:hypothetical protein